MKFFLNKKKNICSSLFIKFKTTVGAVHLLGDVGVGLKSNSRSKEVWLGLVALSAERWP